MAIQARLAEECAPSNIPVITWACRASWRHMPAWWVPYHPLIIITHIPTKLGKDGPRFRSLAAVRRHPHIWAFLRHLHQTFPTRNIIAIPTPVCTHSAQRDSHITLSVREAFGMTLIHMPGSQSQSVPEGILGWTWSSILILRTITLLFPTQKRSHK